MDLVEFVGVTRREGPSEEDLVDEMRERFDFDVEENVAKFVDEPRVRHDVLPDSESDEKEDDPKPEEPLTRRGEGHLYQSQIFFSALAFKETVLDHALKQCRHIKWTRYDKNKIAYECVPVGCRWRIYCSTRSDVDKWVVRNFYSRHTCYPNGECEMLKVQCS